MDMDNQVRVAVIGLGFGINHARNAMLIPEAELVAVCDLREERGVPAREWEVPFYTGFRRMLDEVKPDGVVVAVSNDQHAEVAVECLRRGIPTLLEKPIATTLEEADRIVDMAQAAGTPLLVGHHRRFSTFVQRARELVQSGTLGDLVAVVVIWAILKPDDYYRTEWRTRREMGGGPLLINTVHDVDDLRYICGCEITRVYAELNNQVRGLEVEDSICASLRLANGALVTLLTIDCVPSIWAYESTTSPWENPYFFHAPGDCYYFFGTKASLTLPQLRLISYPDEEHRGWQWPLKVEWLGVRPVHPLREEMRHFCRVIQGLEKPRTSGEDAMKTLEATLALMRSGETGQVVELPIH